MDLEHKAIFRKIGIGLSVTLGGIFLLVGSVILVVLLTRGPEVGLTAVKNGSEVVFQITSKRTNGLLYILVFEKESQKLLWYANLSYYPGPDVTYGRLPATFKDANGNVQRAWQRFPKGGVHPPALPVGVIIGVQVTYQYDSLVSACSGSKYLAVQLENDGSIRSWEAGPSPFVIEANALDD